MADSNGEFQRLLLRCNIGEILEIVNADRPRRYRIASGDFGEVSFVLPVDYAFQFKRTTEQLPTFIIDEI